MRLRELLCGTLAAVAAIGTTTAVVAPQDGPSERAREIRWATANPDHQDRLTAESRAWQRFLERQPGSWSVRWNERNGTPNLVQGGSIELLPQAITGDRAELERITRRFIGSHRELFGVEPGGLRLLEAGTGFHGRFGEQAVALFQQYHRGIPVRHSLVFANFKHGRLVQFGTRVFPDVAVDRRPALTPDVAQQIVWSDAAGYVDVLGETTEPSLVIYPRERHAAPGDVVLRESFEYHLAYGLEVASESPYGRWLYFVDAHTGEVLERVDRIHHQSDGYVRAMVSPRLFNAAQESRPLVNLEVSVALSPVLTDDSGFYDSVNFGNTMRSASLRGAHVEVFNDGGDEAETFDVGIGSVDLVFDDTNSRHDERMVYHHVELVNQVARQYLDLSWLDTSLPANVNINAQCNAFWNGTSINFYRSGTDCNNTGENADVIYHEWGHGIDDNDGNGITSSSFSEGYADTVSTAMTEDCVVGPGFLKDEFPDYVRNNCIKCTVTECGDSFSVHRVGQIVASAAACVQRELFSELGSEAGRSKFQELVFLSLPGTGGIFDHYDHMLLADDDDGDLGNGTPNLCMINECYSDVELVDLLPESDIVLRDPIVDDATGNGDGRLDPGETVQLTWPLANQGCLQQDGLSATLSVAVDDVVVSVATADYGSVAGPGEVTGTAYELTVPSDFPCGAELDVALTVTTANETRILFATLPVGSPTTGLFDELENGLGEWTVEAEAAAGNWELGEPEPTFLEEVSAQPGSDFSEVGTNAFVTGLAAGESPSEHDVDLGPTRLLSPVLDLSEFGNARVSFWRWLFQGTSANDSLEIEASSDGGESWTLLRDITDSEGSWVLEEIELSDSVPLTDSVQLRMSLADEDNDTILEAAIDDLLVEGVMCGVDRAPAQAVVSCGSGPYVPGESFEVPLTVLNVTDVQQRLGLRVVRVEPDGNRVVKLERLGNLPGGGVFETTLTEVVPFSSQSGAFFYSAELLSGGEVVSRSACGYEVEGLF